MEPEDAIDLVLTVGELDATVVTLREFLHRSGAVEVQAVVERADGAPALVTCGRLAPIQVTEGERTVHLPHAVELALEPPDLPSVPPLPPLEVDASGGVVTGPLGGVEAMTRAVSALADVLGARSVALAFFATTAPDTPLGVGARAGEDPIVTLGEEQFRLP
jgi:hypothetical protein